jgi:hypothetical protein
MKNTLEILHLNELGNLQLQEESDISIVQKDEEYI